MRRTLKLRNSKWGFHPVNFCCDITAVDIVNSQNLIIKGEFNNNKLIEIFIRFLKPNCTFLLSVNEKYESFPI
jgi:hypothetical protein